ncbi:hypothetical protein PR048_021195 [Dryococelus australis]|uniref:Uncharacterized protein n=1 Tax=Dryococelus australis TaxID=614101 RepID=A0ABQ9GXI0_9NEOP|nr:hypothetical protein PR048_021195 [Dryococelus australis]
MSADVAHGNFTAESPPAQDAPVQSDVYVEKKHANSQAELPEPMRVTEMGMERCRNGGAGEAGDPEKARRPTASSGTIARCESPEWPGRGLSPDSLCGRAVYPCRRDTYSQLPVFVGARSSVRVDLPTRLHECSKGSMSGKRGGHSSRGNSPECSSTQFWKTWADNTVHYPAGISHPREVSTAREEDHTYMAVIIGVLMAVILLLAVAIYLIVSRHRQRKCFASPLASKPALPGSAANNHQHLPPESSCGTAEKGATLGSYCAKELVDDNYNQSPGGRQPPPPQADAAASSVLLMDVKLDDYQEPYQALKYAPYYSYSTVVMEMRDMLNKCAATQSGTALTFFSLSHSSAFMPRRI